MVNDQALQIVSHIVKESKQDLDLMIQKPDTYEHEIRKLYVKHGFEDKYDEVHDFFTRIEENHHTLLHHKSKGMSTSTWLHQQLAVYEEEDSNFLTELLITILQDMDIETQKGTFGLTSQSGKTGSKSAVRSLFEAITLQTNLQIVSFEQFQKDVPNIVKSEIRAIQEAIKSNLGDPFDVPTKEFITLSMLKVQETSMDETLQSYRASQIASIVDSSYTILKVGYHLANGSVRMSDAMEYIVDRTASRLEALVHSTCKRASEKTGAFVGRIIGSAFGPAGVLLGKFVGTAIGGMIGEKMSNMISSGIHKIAPIVKEKINQGLEMVGGMIDTGVTKIKNFFGW